MKKILFSLAVIGVVSTAAIGATWAAFSDTEVIAGNTFAAGSLDLELGDMVSLPFELLGIAPGDTGEGKVTLTAAQGDGSLDIRITNLVEAEDGCLEPETEAGDSGASCGAGDLGLVLSMTMFLDVDQDGVYNQANGDIELEYSGNTNTTGGLQVAQMRDFEGKDWSDDLLVDLPSLATDGPVDLVINWNFPHDGYAKPDAIFMTDTLAFDVEITLNQN